MAKTFFNNPVRYIFYVFVFVSMYNPHALLADHQCNCEYCDLDIEYEESINYESLDEYEDIFRIFEAKVEEENELDVECGMFNKWGKKAKRWLKKRVVSVLKKCVNLKRIRNAEDCAYTVAKFKRKVDKKHNTGSIDKMFEKFDEHVPDDPCVESFEKFKGRIKYYYDNQDARPPKGPDRNRYDFCMNCSFSENNPYKSDLDDIPTRALLGGVEIACGSLIMVLPFPGCSWLGWTLIGHGTAQIYEGYMQKFEEDQKNSSYSLEQTF